MVLKLPYIRGKPLSIKRDTTREGRLNRPNIIISNYVVTLDFEVNYNKK